MRRVLVAFFALATVPAVAQQLAIYGSGGYGFDSPYSRLYNPNTVIRFTGKVTGKTKGSPMSNTGESMRIIMKASNGGSTLVEVGPSWYVAQQPMRINVGDRLTIVGSKVMLDNRGTVMASQITKGRSGMVLRDANGTPYWAGSRVATTGVAVDTQTPAQRVPVLPLDANRPIYAAPGVLNGTIDHFNIQNGQVFMIMDIGGNPTNVYLGPLWYLQRQDVVLSPGDAVTVNVLTPLSGGQGYVYAQTLTNGSTTLMLRNNTGTNMWAPWFNVVGSRVIGR